MLEFFPAEMLKNSPKPRIYHTHFTPQGLPKHTFDKKVQNSVSSKEPERCFSVNASIPTMSLIPRFYNQMEWIYLKVYGIR